MIISIWLLLTSLILIEAIGLYLVFYRTAQSVVKSFLFHPCIRMLVRNYVFSNQFLLSLSFLYHNMATSYPELLISLIQGKGSENKDSHYFFIWLYLQLLLSKECPVIAADLFCIYGLDVKSAKPLSYYCIHPYRMHKDPIHQKFCLTLSGWTTRTALR